MWGRGICRQFIGQRREETMASRFKRGRGGILALAGTVSLLLAGSPAHAQTVCVGDCNHDNQVLINELILDKNIFNQTDH